MSPTALRHSPHRRATYITPRCGVAPPAIRASCTRQVRLTAVSAPWSRLLRPVVHHTVYLKASVISALTARDSVRRARAERHDQPIAWTGDLLSITSLAVQSNPSMQSSASGAALASLDWVSGGKRRCGCASRVRRFDYAHVRMVASHSDNESASVDRLIATNSSTLVTGAHSTSSPMITRHRQALDSVPAFHFPFDILFAADN